MPATPRAPCKQWDFSNQILSPLQNSDVIEWQTNSTNIAKLTFVCKWLQTLKIPIQTTAESRLYIEIAESWYVFNINIIYRFVFFVCFLLCLKYWHYAQVCFLFLFFCFYGCALHWQASRHILYPKQCVVQLIQLQSIHMAFCCSAHVYFTGQ